MNAFAGTLSADLPLYDERRPVLTLQPRKALHHFRELLKDKERTEEVFAIFEALPWQGLRASAERYLRSEVGQSVRAREPSLPTILDDHDALRRMPAGSVAHAYCDFMEHEGLTAAGLVAEFDKFAEGRPRFQDQFLWYLNRMRDVHDLLHVLTGYGRDALGEACVLAFTYSQQPSPAHLFIGYMAGLNIRKQVKSSAPVLRAIREGQRLGKACPRLCEQAITDILPLGLDEARRHLNITPAVHYHQAHAVWKAMGVDPYDLLGKKKAA
ncbi:Coq4 family protein [Novosphingobium cyanobacteriorum]|uniref:Coq4 family protein n=1 Tax=Novosphingobium cyanobacteriorum TaxID=3024215 RepID=A0ABT6CCK3_9SPHN|nr:Coq4 family protein [Novosphingobium cyanobacteriorum]MDF8331655.1 Coq4 family protein [Novosphingobium cyanobacteriorum]